MQELGSKMLYFFNQHGIFQTIFEVNVNYLTQLKESLDLRCLFNSKCQSLQLPMATDKRNASFIGYIRRYFYSNSNNDIDWFLMANSLCYLIKNVRTRKCTAAPMLV